MSHRGSEVSRARAWILAARPKTLPAAVAPVLVGAGLAAFRDTFRPLPALAALVGAVLIQVATNLANDYYDFVRGSDTEERVGPVRVTQAGLIEPERVRRGMLVALALAALVGVYLVSLGGWPILAVGVASLICAVAYTAGPLPLAYHGLGDLFVFVFFGLVAVGGTYWVQALELRWELLLAGAAMGALNTAILVANNLRDLESDARAGKGTLAVRVGRTGTRIEYLLMLMTGFAAPPLGVALFEWTPWCLAALAALPFAAPPVRRVLTRDDPAALIPALGGTARMVALYGLLLAGGLALG